MAIATAGALGWSGLLAGGLPQARAATPLPPIRHVFVMVLENEDYSTTFGDPSAFPYLDRTLGKQGALLPNYYAIGHASNDDYVALVSGQPPNVQNQADCPVFSNFIGGHLRADGIETGIGCVYPANVPNIGTQLSAVGRNWKAYGGDMGNDPHRESAACGHPAVGSVDHTGQAEARDGYTTRHDPFVYFHAVIDKRAYCDAHVVALGSRSGAMPTAALAHETGLATDLKRVSTTPAFSFVTPNLCDDGHDYPCVNELSGGSAAADIDRFLKIWVPLITGSAAFKQNGLLEIVFDESSGSDDSACCGERSGPGSPLPGILGQGGGRVGALLLSPYIKGGTVSTTRYNHYTSLATWEELFGLRRLANAATVTSTFGAGVFTRPGG